MRSRLSGFTSWWQRTVLLFITVILTVAWLDPKGVVAAESEGGGEQAARLTKSWTLLHATDDGMYKPRAHIRMQIKPNVAEPDGDDEDEDPLGLTMEPIEIDDKDSWLESIKTSSWYYLQLVPDDPDKAATGVVWTSVPACQLRRANFRDEFLLHLGRTADVLSLTYMPLISPLAPADCSDETLFFMEPANDKPLFDSKVKWEAAVPAMTTKTVLPHYQPPPGLKVLKGASTTTTSSSTGAGGGEDGEQQQQQEPPDNSPMGFLQRYWYIILPLVISNLISAPPEEPQQQGGGGGGEATGQQQQSAAANAPAGGAAAAAGEAKPRTRRGKKG